MTSSTAPQPRLVHCAAVKEPSPPTVLAASGHVGRSGLTHTSENRRISTDVSPRSVPVHGQGGRDPRETSWIFAGVRRLSGGGSGRAGQVLQGALTEAAPDRAEEAAPAPPPAGCHEKVRPEVDTACRSHRAAALTSQNQELSFGCVMNVSWREGGWSCADHVRRRASNSSKRRPWRTSNGVRFVATPRSSDGAARCMPD